MFGVLFFLSPMFRVLGSWFQNLTCLSFDNYKLWHPFGWNPKNNPLHKVLAKILVKKILANVLACPNFSKAKFGSKSIRLLVLLQGDKVW
jgi:hypothetical protein